MTKTSSARRIAPEVPDEDELHAGAMGFLEHLDELRTRLIRACAGIAVGMLVAFTFVGQIRDFVLEPARRMLPPGSHFIFTQPGEGFSLHLTLAFIAGGVLAAPYVAWQVWLFIAPALFVKEKRFAIPFVLLTTVGGLCGAAFGHYVVFPSMMAFFATFSSPNILFMPRLEDTVALYIRTLGGMMLAFQIPTLVFFLAKMRLVAARFLWRHAKYAFLASFIVAAVLTPSPDPWNQMMFAGPIIALYLLSIGIAWLVRHRETSDATDPASAGLRLVIGATVMDQALRRRPH